MSRLSQVIDFAEKAKGFFLNPLGVFCMWLWVGNTIASENSRAFELATSAFFLLATLHFYAGKPSENESASDYRKRLILEGSKIAFGGGVISYFLIIAAQHSSPLDSP